jgi:homocysteine S-methyltransferase
MRRAGIEGREEGVAIAREMLAAVKDRIDGAYIMPPFGRHELALRVIEGIVR